MKIRILLFVLIVSAIFVFCHKQPSNITPIDKADKESVNILFKIPIPSEVQAYVHSAFAQVTATDMDTIIAPLEVTSTHVEGVIENVPVGKNRFFEIFVFDQDSALTYYGSDIADIYPDLVTQVEIMLQPVTKTGTVIIFGYFGTPKTEKIVYSTFDSQWPYDDGEIFIMDPDGSNIIQLTENPGADYHPQISPDGEKIVFVRNLDPMGFDSHVFIMNIDGTEETQLTFPPIREDGPCFSPQGDQIVYRKTTANGVSNLFVMKADGSNKVNITQDRIGVLHPFWARDNYIYFVTHGNDYRIWRIRPDGSELQVVSPFQVGAHEKVKFTRDMRYILYDSYEFPNQIMKAKFPNFDNLRAITSGDDTGGFCLSPDNSKVIFSQGSHESGYYLYIKDFISNETTALGIKAIHSDWKMINR